MKRRCMVLFASAHFLSFILTDSLCSGGACTYEDLDLCMQFLLPPCMHKYLD